jgi:hypothetical protein
MKHKKSGRKHASASAKHKDKDLKTPASNAVAKDEAANPSLNAVSVYEERESANDKKEMSKLREQEAAFKATIKGLEAENERMAGVVTKKEERLAVMGGTMKQTMNKTLKSHVEQIKYTTHTAISYANCLTKDYPTARTVVLDKVVATLEKCLSEVMLEATKHRGSKKRKREESAEEDLESPARSKLKVDCGYTGLGTEGMDMD